MADKDLTETLKHGVAVVTGLANEGKFVYSGVVHSLIQALRVTHNDGVAYQKEFSDLLANESKALAMLRQVRSDLQYLINDNYDVVGKGRLTTLLNTVTNFLPPEVTNDPPKDC